MSVELVKLIIEVIEILNFFRLRLLVSWSYKKKKFFRGNNRVSSFGPKVFFLPCKVCKFEIFRHWLWGQSWDDLFTLAYHCITILKHLCWLRHHTYTLWHLLRFRGQSVYHDLFFLWNDRNMLWRMLMVKWRDQIGLLHPFHLSMFSSWKTWAFCESIFIDHRSSTLKRRTDSQFW